MYRETLLVLLCVTSAVYAVNEKVVVCYYGTWATYRPGLGKFDVDNVDVNLCTHLMYAFVGINETGTIISLDTELDLPENNGKNNFKKFNDLKNKNPNLKTILAVGGWSEGSAKYSVMAASAKLRRNFIDSALNLLINYGFDGLDLDWEYPNRRDTVYGEADIDNFSQLTKELREEFDKHGFILTAAVSAVEEAASQSYDIPAISKYLHYINVMSYDLHGAWDNVTGHNAALHPGEGDENEVRETLFTVDNAVEYWLRAGCPPEKLVLGVPFYGRTFQLTDPNTNGVRAPAKGAGIGGPYTATEGFLGYNEFCDKLQKESWTKRRDELARVPYAFKDDNWVTYDDVESLKIKTEYALSLNLAGIMLWSIETDDFNNVCGGGEFPLLRSINHALNKDITAPDTTSAPIDTTTAADIETTTKNIATTTVPSVTVSPGPAESGSEICKQLGFTPNPQDCSSYFVCIQHASGLFIPVKFSCPPTLVWDQKFLFCNYKDQVVCDV